MRHADVAVVVPVFNRANAVIETLATVAAANDAAPRLDHRRRRLEPTGPLLRCALDRSRGRGRRLRSVCRRAAESGRRCGPQSRHSAKWATASTSRSSIRTISWQAISGTDRRRRIDGDVEPGGRRDHDGSRISTAVEDALGQRSSRGLERGATKAWACSESNFGHRVVHAVSLVDRAASWAATNARLPTGRDVEFFLRAGIGRVLGCMLRATGATATSATRQPE